MLHAVSQEARGRRSPTVFWRRRPAMAWPSLARMAGSGRSVQSRVAGCPVDGPGAAGASRVIASVHVVAAFELRSRPLITINK
eukprot:1352011-Prymnesium_polylepis.1